ncbi:MAG: GTPase [Planctomycetota bacterium]
MARSDTIAALASAPGPAERAVLRVSGPGARCVLERTTDARPAGRAALSARIHASSGDQRGLVLWMPGPASFTGEDVLELHVLGHPGWASDVLGSALDAGARLAEPGEFTRRAFENGRIDLTRAEGVAALVEAGTREEARAALELLGGGLEERVLAIRRTLEDARSLAEASLDFDEADTGHVPGEEIGERVTRARAAVAEAEAWEVRRSARARRPTVVLGGAPNAGKSTLFNRLARSADEEWAGPALVSDEAGTTRDLKRGTLDLGDGGPPVDLVDTAGRLGTSFEGDGDLDARADSLSARALRAADVVVWVVDASTETPSIPLPEADPARTVLAWNQIDRGPAHSVPPGAFLERVRGHAPTSGANGEGLDALVGLVRSALGRGPAREGGAGPAAAGLGFGLGARHHGALRRAAHGLDRAAEALARGVPLDLVAEDLRGATEALDGITGRTTPEDLLTRIFARFCLGK